MRPTLRDVMADRRCAGSHNSYEEKIWCACSNDSSRELTGWQEHEHEYVAKQLRLRSRPRMRTAAGMGRFSASALCEEESTAHFPPQVSRREIRPRGLQ